MHASAEPAPARAATASGGTTNQQWEIGALAIIAVVTLTASWLLLRRGMSRA